MKRDRTDVTQADSGTRTKIGKAKASKGRGAAPPPPEKIRYARAKFDAVVLVCTKCAKRQGLPKGAVRSVLKRALKERAEASGARRAKPRLVEVGCLGPCPKRAVAVATTASLAQGRIALIDPAGDRQAILDALLPESRLPEVRLPEVRLPEVHLPEFGPKATLTPPGAPEDSAGPGIS